MADQVEPSTRLPEYLAKLECPYTWDVQYDDDCDIQVLKGQMLRKADEDDLSEDGGILAVTVLLALSHENARGEDFDSALKVLEEALAKSQQDLLHLFKDAFHYVAHAQRAHILYRKGDEAQALEAMKECPQKVKDELQYVVKGIQGAVLREYGRTNWIQAKICLKEAIEFDTSYPQRQGEWYFMYSNLLGRERHSVCGKIGPTDEEVDALEKANKLLNTCSSNIFLADVYMDKSMSLYNINKDDANVEKLNRSAIAICKETLPNIKNHVRLLLRCACILRRAPHKYRDLDLSEQVYKDAFALSPDNPSVNHGLGKFYEYHRKDLRKAEWYYKRASKQGLFKPTLSVVFVRWQRSHPKFDVVPELTELLVKFTDNRSACIIHIELGCYYWFVKKNLVDAATVWLEAMKICEHVELLQGHASPFLNGRKINIHDVLEKELQAALLRERDSIRKNIFQDSLRRLGNYKTIKQEEF